MSRPRFRRTGAADAPADRAIENGVPPGHPFENARPRNSRTAKYISAPMIKISSNMPIAEPPEVPSAA
jgi:hypothetical protein